jgi:hypothetical protein
MATKTEIPDFLKIEIHHAQGAEVYDPNTIVMKLLSNTSVFENLQSPAVLSVLSGRPALVYKTSEVELALAPDEIERLVMRSLSQGEVRELRKQYGSFFEIHDDFYDSKTFVALQPKR